MLFRSPPSTARTCRIHPCVGRGWPFDERKPFDPSGIRIGKQIASWIADVVEAPEDKKVVARVKGEVTECCASFAAPWVPG